MSIHGLLKKLQLLAGNTAAGY